MNLGNRIREARISQQLTQKDVVGEYMTRNMLSKIENGSATPSVKTLEFIAGSLSLPVSYFVSEEGEKIADTPELADHLREIILLADRMLDDSEEKKHKAEILCIKARALLAQGDTASAFGLLDGCDLKVFGASEKRQIYKVLEACCKAREDYKKAYDYACLRMETGDK